jgi:hypothetical protein
MSTFSPAIASFHSRGEKSQRRSILHGKSTPSIAQSHDLANLDTIAVFGQNRGCDFSNEIRWFQTSIVIRFFSAMTFDEISNVDRRERPLEITSNM